MIKREIGNATLYCADCRDVFPLLEPVDSIVTDPPYGTTACRWDKELDLGQLWESLSVCAKPSTVYVMTAAQPFSSKLVMSNLEMFKYEMVWCKTRALGFFNAKNKPMNAHEVVLIFSKFDCANRCKNRMTYNPQGLTEVNKPVCGLKGGKSDTLGHRFGRPSHLKEYVQTHTGYPTSVIRIPSEPKPEHPTQKPVELMRYLIKTYTQPGGVVLDPFMGSGSTGVAATTEGMRFIGVEMNRDYFEIACKRIEYAPQQLQLEL